MLEVVNNDAMDAYRQDLRIVPAALGDDPGLIGAGLLTHETISARKTPLREPRAEVRGRESGPAR
jgi:hypothetical protein